MAGEILKNKREELGLSIAEVAALLRIRAEYLSSIEEDRFEKLPVAVYTIGYIRSYAAYLRLDPEPILSVYSGNLSQPAPSAVLPIASSRRKTPVYYYIVPLVGLFLVALVMFIVLRQGGSEQEGRIAPMPAKPVPQEKPPQAEPAPQLMPQLPQTGLPPDKSPAPDAAPSVTRHQIEITADDLSWVQLTFPGGRSEEVLLKPGEVKKWIFDGNALLKLGNAGGVTLNLDGRDIGRPGDKSQVRTISLPENRLVVKGSAPGNED